FVARRRRNAVDAGHQLPGEFDGDVGTVSNAERTAESREPHHAETDLPGALDDVADTVERVVTDGDDVIEKADAPPDEFVEAGEA
ncbi:hypothetical protein FE62_15505, partial [Staphylococcus aureus]